MRLVLLVVAAALVGLAVLGGATWWLTGELGGPSRDELAVGTADDYLSAWEASAWPVMASLAGGRDAEEFADAHEELLGGLAMDGHSFTPGPVTVTDDLAEAGFTAAVDLDELGEWSYEGALQLGWVEDEWLVDWSPATVHPALGASDRLDQSLDWPEREAILAHDGTVLSGPHEIVAVGFEPRRVEDPDGLADALAEHAGADAGAVAAELGRDDLVDDWFYPVAELGPGEADEARDELDGMEGVVFRETSARLTPADGFAQHVLGGTGEVTEELLEELGPPYSEGRTVGRAGLERVFERRLAGTPTGEVRVLDADGEVVEALTRIAGADPAPVRTALDADVQLAADAALDGLDRPAALVAIDGPTGELRAVASRPLGEFERGLGARYAPGSTFKVVTAAALLDGGVAPDDEVACPARAPVGGRTFRNAGDRDLGTVSFAEAFAESCNTSFIMLAEDLPEDALPRAAATFGFGSEPALPLPAAAPRFPDPADAVEQAAAAIGQGRVEASPAHMASVAAAVASGAWRPPVLLLDDGDGAGDREADVADDAEVASADVIADLMRRVVTEGTGEAADLGDPPVAGKTGSAEFGDGDESHAWFIGFREDLAFAVLVEGGGAGGEVAAPVAADFLSALD